MRFDVLQRNPIYSGPPSMPSTTRIQFDKASNICTIAHHRLSLCVYTLALQLGLVDVNFPLSCRSPLPCNRHAVVSSNLMKPKSFLFASPGACERRLRHLFFMLQNRQWKTQLLPFVRFIAALLPRILPDRTSRKAQESTFGSYPALVEPINDDLA